MKDSKLCLMREREWDKDNKRNIMVSFKKQVHGEDLIWKCNL